MKKYVLLIFTATLLIAAGGAYAQSGASNPVVPATNNESDAATGIASMRGNDGIAVYPNPAYGELNVLFDINTGIRNITVYNLIGKAITVYKVNGNSAKLDTENLPSGIYFIRLIDGQGRVVATRKFTHQ